MMKNIIAVIMWFYMASLVNAQSPLLTADNMLPLAVGNSWEYVHSVHDLLVEESVFFAQNITITITHTEEIEGQTYFVFSDMPYKDPPVPFFFLANKKVRFDGNALVFRERDSDVALYQFDLGAFGQYSYAIPETSSDTLVVAQRQDPGRHPGLAFDFQGHGKGDGSSVPDSYFGNNAHYFELRGASFVSGFGLFSCDVQGQIVPENGHNDQFEKGNRLSFNAATINDVELTMADVWNASVVREIPWSTLKRKFTLSKRRK